MSRDQDGHKPGIAGPHIEGGLARFGEPVKKGGDGLRSRNAAHEDLVDQDTPGKHEPTAQQVRGGPTIEPATQAPEGLLRKAKGALGPRQGRRQD